MHVGKQLLIPCMTPYLLYDVIVRLYERRDVLNHRQLNNLFRPDIENKKDTLIKFCGRPSLFYFVCTLGSTEFTNCVKGSVSCLRWSHSAVSCRCMKVTISNQTCNHVNQYIACDCWIRGLFTRYVKLRVAHAPKMPRTFFPPPRVCDPDMHHGTCVTPVL